MIVPQSGLQRNNFLSRFNKKFVLLLLLLLLLNIKTIFTGRCRKHQVFYSEYLRIYFV